MKNQEEQERENPLMNLINKNIDDENEINQQNNKYRQNNINPIHQYYNPIINNQSSNKNPKDIEPNYEELLNRFGKLELDESSKIKISSPKKPEQNNYFQNPMMNNNKNNQKEMGAFNYFFGSGMQGGDLSKKIGENPLLGQLGYNLNNEQNIEDNKEEKKENNNYKMNYKYGNNNNDINQQEERPIESELYKDQFLLRWDKLKYILIPFLIMAGLSILRESQIVSKCSSFYWVLMFSFLVIVMIYDYFIFKHIETEYSYRRIKNFPYDERDINWTKETIIKLCCIGFLAGFIAGVIGIGGGVVLGPILLDLGIHPIVGTVTTNMLVLITSSSTTFQFILFKMLNLEYGVICIVFSALGSYCGTYLVNTYVKKTGKQSFIVLILFCVVITSAIVLPLSSLINIIEDYNKGYNIFEFESLC